MRVWTPTIIKKLGILMLLVVVGSVAGLLSFYQFKRRTATQAIIVSLTRDQLEIVECIPLMAELIIRGSPGREDMLQHRIHAFDRVLSTLERGRAVGQNGMALPPVDGEARESLLAVKVVWSEVRDALLTIASGTPSEQAVAYDKIRAVHRQFEDSSERLAVETRGTFAELEAGVFTTLAMIAIVDAFLLLGALWLGHRFIVRPIRLIEEGTQRIAHGEFGVQVQLVTDDDLAALGRSFNSMSRELARLIDIEKHMVHGQKMEAIGQLASGTAHDFNNLLLGIIGHTEFAAEQISPGSTAQEDLRQVLMLAQRGADLNRQLLLFGRRQPQVRKPVDLKRILAETVDTLRRTIGEDITVTFKQGPLKHLASADETQVKQVVMNLAINARDAMPHGGTLTIESREVHVPARQQNVPGFVSPGDYVAFVVRDTGCGMDEHTLKHVFEPFFTTKDVGKGTGLGLASAYAIVKQHDGYIWMDSQVGRGTTVTIYWPRLERATTAEAPERKIGLVGGRERILVVEDQAPIRTLLTRLLAQLGYKTTVVDSPAQAELHIARHGCDFDLLLSDVVMPGASGPELYDRLIKRYPGLRVLFMSGATDRASRAGCPANLLLPKPFTAEELSGAIRAVFDTGALGISQ